MSDAVAEVSAAVSEAYNVTSAPITADIPLQQPEQQQQQPEVEDAKPVVDDNTMIPADELESQLAGLDDF